jgi:hypothetical protein
MSQSLSAQLNLDTIFDHVFVKYREAGITYYFQDIAFFIAYIKQNSSAQKIKLSYAIPSKNITKTVVAYIDVSTVNVGQRVPRYVDLTLGSVFSDADYPSSPTTYTVATNWTNVPTTPTNFVVNATYSIILLKSNATAGSNYYQFTLTKTGDTFPFNAISNNPMGLIAFVFGSNYTVFQHFAPSNVTTQYRYITFGSTPPNNQFTIQTFWQEVDANNNPVSIEVEVDFLLKLINITDGT